jgi:hypothetical protein
MPVSSARAADYFLPPKAAFWSWQDECRVLVWADGVTLAFEPELQAVLDRLVSSGLPPFGSLLMLLAACRDNWDAEPKRAHELRRLLRNLSGTRASDLCLDVIYGLRMVHRLPRELRATTAAKVEIAAMVFEASPSRLTLARSADILQAFEAGLVLDPTDDIAPQDGLTALLGDLAALRDGLDRFDADALSLRLKTGLEQPVQAAPIELDPVGRVRNLIAQLEDDEELGGLARLTRLLMAAVQLPRSLADPEDLPLGGVSDISNRGALDRLLLSELAHDDLTLAVRVAVNEALYLRRESPPRTPPRQRSVLLDSGVRLWGVPRVFSTAVGLALAATADSRLEVNAFRAAGTSADPVDLTTREGLISHLATLDHRAHPGEALAELAERLSEEAQPADLVLITSEDVLADRAFQQILAHLPLAGFHIATVARDGRFRLLERTPRGSKLLREARLSLDEVLAPRRKRQLSLIDPSADALPAIFGVRPFPLRLSCPRDLESTWHVADCGVFSYYQRRLLHWTGPAVGARELAAELPKGKLQWCASHAPRGVAIAVIGNLRCDGLHVLRIDTGDDDVRCVPLRLEPMVPEEVFCRDGVAMVIGHRDRQPRINLASLETGETLIAKQLPAMGPRRGCYFEHHTSAGKLEWHALSFDGFLQIHTVLESPLSDRRVLTMFDVRGQEGPLAVTIAGDIFDTSSNKLRNVPHGLEGPVRVRGISRDGCRLLLAERYDTATASHKLVLVETLTGQCRQIQFEHVDLLEPQLAQFARPRGLRHKFHAIAVDAQRRLALVGRHDHVWPLVLDPQGTHLMFPLAPQPLERTKALVPFDEVASQAPPGISLQMARWPDGSRAWLDGRGLLHLQSSSPDVPQCTIVLAERMTAGWVADGRTWGDRYFLEDSPTATVTEIEQQVLRAFIDRLP